MWTLIPLYSNFITGVMQICSPSASIFLELREKITSYDREWTLSVLPCNHVFHRKQRPRNLSTTKNSMITGEDIFSRGNLNDLSIK